ncbi:flagellar biosynthesis protein FlhA [Thalassobius vesicularis]|uniref:Flagellar biosynthesis protein FlhA n=2 Tax=Thalassobius vesicularis TaxID=1294297 RepID=A0A4S3M956_9RHOB|nr:flagellar biosynthesis protein FlhA [Thalassobius vesicularis]THD74133.1 flagellar biosynthesis protein FlhA [Thalassobius vesicularis]
MLRPPVLLALALMAIIVMMVLPVPAFVLDVGLAVSFALAILIFTMTLFIERPLDFSSFPTVLLASLMLRLSLNVSSTKLIIGEGHTGTRAAGNVIEGFANFVMGGNIFLGLVVFGVLLIVNFMVITKGAARMAEVGARFALDGMPGKQLAIDSDMSAGAINHAEARERREREQLETTFFGSLDGASKFVKGDAVAGLLITLLNLVMGLIMGVAVHGMPVSTAFETYAILTVGDGLVTQIPAVIISIASALLLARGGAIGATDLTLLKQMGAHPTALATVATIMLLFALVPGLPFLPFVLGGGGLAYAAFHLHRKRQAMAVDEQVSAPEPIPRDKPIADILALEDIHLEFAPDLVNMVLDPATGLDVRISNMRTHVASVYGLILPEIRLTDEPALPSGSYVIRIQGVEIARAKLRSEKVLALLSGDAKALPAGEDIAEPVYNAPARWLEKTDQEAAALAGATIVLPAEVLATHLLEVVKRNFSKLLTFKAMRRLLDEMVNQTDRARSEANRKLLDDLIPEKVPFETLQGVLKQLLEEQVSIRNLPLILEAIAEGRAFSPSIDIISEHVRQRLGFQLVAGLKRADGTIPLIQLAPEWEEAFTAYQLDGDIGGSNVALPPDLFNRLASNMSEKVSEAADRGIFAAVVTSTQRRRFLKTLVKAKGISAPILSFDEIGLEARPTLVGVVAP